MSSSDDKFWRAVGRWCSSNPKPSVVTEAIAPGVNWPETFKATVKSFSRGESITFELESGDLREVVLRDFRVRVSSVRTPRGDLAEWNIVGSFSLLDEANDAGLTFTELREFGKEV